MKRHEVTFYFTILSANVILTGMEVVISITSNADFMVIA